MKHLAVYGSLRKGAYNYDRFKAHFPEGIEYLETTEVEGFVLHDLGYGYPCVTKGDATLVVDILKVSDDAYNSITAMEEGAGYKTESLKVGDYNANIYTYQESDSPIVESGDWIKHVK